MLARIAGLAERAINDANACTAPVDPARWTAGVTALDRLSYITDAAATLIDALDERDAHADVLSAQELLRELCRSRSKPPSSLSRSSTVRRVRRPHELRLLLVAHLAGRATPAHQAIRDDVMQSGPHRRLFGTFDTANNRARRGRHTPPEPAQRRQARRHLRTPVQLRRFPRRPRGRARTGPKFLTAHATQLEAAQPQ
jgi:hypothetical protein